MVSQPCQSQTKNRHAVSTLTQTALFTALALYIIKNEPRLGLPKIFLKNALPANEIVLKHGLYIFTISLFYFYISTKYFKIKCHYFSAWVSNGRHHFFVSFLQINTSMDPQLYFTSETHVNLTVHMFHRNRPYDVIHGEVFPGKVTQIKLPADARMTENTVEMKG